MPEREITLCLFSDTHELHREIEMPPASLYICAGDFSMMSRSMVAVRDFNAWLGELGGPVILTGGNHEFFLERDPKSRSLLSNATVLINQSTEALGLKLWATPTTPLYSGAFGLSNPADRVRMYATIPEDTDIIISHGPPFGVLDISPGSNHHAGDPELLEAVQRIQPMLHVFGHVHGYGTEEIDDTLFVNAALLGAGGGIEHKPVLVRVRSS